MSVPDVQSEDSSSATTITEPEQPPVQWVGKRGILIALTQLGLMRIALSFAGLVRIKVMAVYLHPAGFSEFAQLINIAEVLNVFVQFGTLVGLNRNTAAAGDRAGRQRQLETANFGTSALALCSLALIIPFLLSPGSDSLLASLGIHPGARQKAILFALFLVAPIEALRINYLSFLSGLIDIKGISSKRTIGVIVTTIVAVPLVVFFGVAGACMQVATASLFLAFLLGARCKEQGYKALAFKWHKDAAKALAYLGAASLLSGFALNATDAVIRARLIENWGAVENGLYQAAFSLSGQILIVILTSVGTYAIGTLSQTRDPQTLTARVEELLRVVLPLSMIGLGAVGILAHPLFALLFSAQFHAGTKFLPLLLASSFVQGASSVVGAPLLGCGYVRTWTVIQLAGVVIRYVAFTLSTGLLGPYSVPAGLVAAMVFDLLINLVVCRYCIGISIKITTTFAIVMGTCAVTACGWLGAFVNSWPASLVGGIILTGLAASMVWSEVVTTLKRLRLQYWAAA